MGFDYLSLVDEYISYLQFIKGFSPSYCYTSKYILRSWFDVTYDLDSFDVDNALDIVGLTVSCQIQPLITTYQSSLRSFHFWRKEI